MDKIQVLMSTYNGEKYVAQQIESIIHQTYKNVSILIRDDGSTDSTTTIIKQYEGQHPDKIKLISAENVGVVNSFWSLLHMSDPLAEYYCFCDQDDVWLSDKIERAIKKLKDHSESPSMIFTSTQLTNEELVPLKRWPDPPTRQPSFYNALVQNIAVGATITFNHKARLLLCSKSGDTNKILMHDWWTYLCVSAFGQAFYDETPSILYRQHSSNVVGGHISVWNLLKSKWRSFNKHKGQRLLYKQALEFYNLYGSDLDEQKRKELLLFITPRNNILSRFQYMNTCKLYRQSMMENALFRFLLLIGYI